MALWKRIPYLLSKPIHESQVHHILNNINYIHLYLIINPELQQTILSFGDDVTVVEPLELKILIQNTLNSMITNYRGLEHSH